MGFDIWTWTKGLYTHYKNCLGTKELDKLFTRRQIHMFLNISLLEFVWQYKAHSTSQIHNINFPFKVFFSRRISTDPIKIHTEPIKKPTDPIKIKCTDKQGEYHRIQVKSYKDLFMNFNHSTFLDRKVVYISNIIWSN